MTALHGAVALAQINGIAVLVGHDLDLDMPRVLEELFHVHDRVAERGLRLGTGGGHGIEQGGFRVNHPHATSAAAAGCLDDHRVADSAGDLDDLLRILGQCAVRAGYAGDARRLHGVLGGHLVAHQADGVRAWANEDEAGLFHAFGEVGVF
ncbi:hypothetical protein SDC9_153710 [bioreactor metagenome]|uniref:Uncharacterized protein n=1 Tax=bioreactor metagenome TaxID=1076179 RepID=A0A645F1F8_9ZZZZ